MQTEKKIINWAIIGCGKHATQVMIPAFSSSSTAVLTALASQTPDNQARVAKLCPQAKIYQDYAELLTDESIDAVYIGLANHLHAKWSIAALDSGKHVLCDKPLALNAREAKEIQAVAKKNQRLCIPAFMYRFHPQYKKIKSVIAQASLGDIRLIEGHFHYSLDDYSNIRWKKECGGGALLDVACYIIDAAQFILGEKISVSSAHLKIHPQHQVDEFVSAQLQSSSGVSIHLCASSNMPRENSLTIYGTKGVMKVERAFRVPRNSQARLLLQLLDDKQPQRIMIPAANQFSLEIDTFSRRISGQAVDTDLFSDSIATMEVIDDIREKGVHF